jgi:hypothetical protein
MPANDASTSTFRASDSPTNLYTCSQLPKTHKEQISLPHSPHSDQHLPTPSHHLLPPSHYSNCYIPTDLQYIDPFTSNNLNSFSLESPFTYNPPTPLAEHSAYNYDTVDTSPYFSRCHSLSLFTPSPSTRNTESVSSTFAYATSQLSSMTTVYDDNNDLRPGVADTEQSRDGGKMRKRKSKKGEGLNKILDALSDAHLSAVSLLLNVLDPDKPQFEKRRNHILGNKSTSVEKLLNILCKDDRARNDVFSWIATSPFARTAITDIIRREMATASLSTKAHTNKDITPEFLQNWTVTSYTDSAPLLYSVLHAAAESSRQEERNMYKKPDKVRHSGSTWYSTHSSNGYFSAA